MKKILLSLCLLGVVAPHATQTNASSIASSITNIITYDNTKKAVLISAVAWYFLIFKKRKPVAVEGEWEWSNVITKYGEEGYFSKEILGNCEEKKEVELSSLDEETGITKTVKDKETIRKSYGVCGRLDALIINKLKDVVELIKNIKSFSSFLKNPMTELGL